MIEIISEIIGSFSAGAIAAAGGVGGKVLNDAYNALREILAQKLGKSGALQSVADDPESELAQAVLASALARTDAAQDAVILTHVETLRAAIERSVLEGSAVSIGNITARVNVTVRELISAGTVSIGDVRAETGSVEISRVSGGVSLPKNP